MNHVKVRYNPMNAMAPQHGVWSGLMITTVLSAYSHKAMWSALDWAFFYLDCIPMVACSDQAKFDQVVGEWKHCKGIPESVVIKNVYDTIDDIMRDRTASQSPIAVVYLDVESIPGDFQNRASARRHALQQQYLAILPVRVQYDGRLDRAIADANIAIHYNNEYSEPDDPVSYSCTKFRGWVGLAQNDYPRKVFVDDEAFEELKQQRIAELVSA